MSTHFAQAMRDRATVNAQARVYSICRRGKWVHHTIGSLEASSDAAARHLMQLGVTHGQRVLILVPAGFELFAIMFAVMKLGAIPVLVDPGVSPEALKRCLLDTAPEVMVSISKGHLLRVLRPATFQSVRLPISLGHFGGPRLSLRPTAAVQTPVAISHPPEGEPAAILFTSGSTGVPKGCAYSHAQFCALSLHLNRELGLTERSVDLSTFPIFGLFAPVLGMISVLPDIDFQRPGRVNPLRLLEAIETTGCSTMFGSPALMQRLVDHMNASGQKLTLSRILTAGAPVSQRLLNGIREAAPNATVLTPFGATECLLVSVADSSSVPAAGPLGVCVGQPISGHQVRVIAVTDQPIADWKDAVELPAGEIGEITVAGPLVSNAYAGREDLTHAAKIRDGERIVHRMGDAGAIDREGRLWVAGRLQHRVETKGETLFPVPFEALADGTEGVARSALISAAGTPTLLLELLPGVRFTEVAARVTHRLLAGRVNAPPVVVREAREPFPVDPRHNAKIDRTRLSAQWNSVAVQAGLRRPS